MRRGLRDSIPRPSLDATTTLAIHPCSYPRHLRNCARPVWCASTLVDLALLEPRAPLLAHIRSCRSSFPDFCVLANLTSVLLLGAAGQGELQPRAAVGCGDKERSWRAAGDLGWPRSRWILPLSSSCMSLTLHWRGVLREWVRKGPLEWHFS